LQRLKLKCDEPLSNFAFHFNFAPLHLGKIPIVHLLTEQAAAAPGGSALGSAAAMAALPGATGVSGAQLAAARAKGNDENFFGPGGIFTETLEMLQRKCPHACLVRLGTPT
jgi:hypothetical protein